MFCFVLIESPPSGRIHILYANLTDWSVLYICSTQQKWKVARCLTPEHLLFSVSEKKNNNKKTFWSKQLAVCVHDDECVTQRKTQQKGKLISRQRESSQRLFIFLWGLPMFKNLHLHANLGRGMIACCKPIFSMCFRVFTYVYRWLLWLFQCSNTVREIHCSLHNSS